MILCFRNSNLKSNIRYDLLIQEYAKLLIKPPKVLEDMELVDQPNDNDSKCNCPTHKHIKVGIINCQQPSHWSTGYHQVSTALSLVNWVSSSVNCSLIGQLGIIECQQPSHWSTGYHRVSTALSLVNCVSSTVNSVELINTEYCTAWVHVALISSNVFRTHSLFARYFCQLTVTGSH